MQSHICVFIERGIKQPFWGKIEIIGIARASFSSPKLIWNTTVKNMCTTVFFSLFCQQDLVDQVQLCSCGLEFGTVSSDLAFQSHSSSRIVPDRVQ